MSDASGNRPAGELYTYDAYGNMVTGTTSGQPFRYTGRRWDDETGLYYYRARYYSAELGRFLQTDPIGYEDNMNMYGYTGNDPVNKIDPFGLADCTVETAGSEVEDTRFTRVTCKQDEDTTSDVIYKNLTDDQLDGLDTLVSNCALAVACKNPAGSGDGSEIDALEASVAIVLVEAAGTVIEDGFGGQAIDASVDFFGPLITKNNDVVKEVVEEVLKPTGKAKKRTRQLQKREKLRQKRERKKKRRAQKKTQTSN